jgi:hypothetical protein
MKWTIEIPDKPQTNQPQDKDSTANCGPLGCDNMKSCSCILTLLHLSQSTANLKMEEWGSSEMYLSTYRIVWHHNPKIMVWILTVMKCFLILNTRGQKTTTCGFILSRLPMTYQSSESTVHFW